MPMTSKHFLCYPGQPLFLPAIILAHNRIELTCVKSFLINLLASQIDGGALLCQTPIDSVDFSFSSL